MERDLRDYLQRQGTPITEHDVAEYMNALLKGTREHLETLVSAKFPLPTSLATGSHRMLGEIPASPQGGVGDATSSLTASLHTSPSDLVTRVGSPLLVTDEGRPTRPRWLLPVILTLAVILVMLLAVAVWS